MGQTVSYILRRICGEESDEENLPSYPLNSNSSSKSWIDSSSANNVAKHQFMFNHLDIQVSHENAQRRRSCIDSTNIDRVLQPDNLLVAPPNLVPSIYPNISSSRTGGTLLHKVFSDPPTIVASVDLSSDKALLHHKFFVDPSTYAPSMGRIERKIKHYSSSQKILLVGEGDFSFSACLARAFGSASNIVATSLDSTEFLRANYKNAMSNIFELMIRGGNVMHRVDATQMARNCLINDSVYDRIIYNFPHDGFFKNEPREMQLKRHRGLVAKFFENAKELISADGEIHISHKSYGFFLEWNLPLLASQVGLGLIEEVPFDLKDYKGYETKYGFGGDRNFDCNPSKTYKFGFET